MIRITFLMVLLCMGITTQAQTILGWSDLSDGISFDMLSMESLVPGFQKATFSTKMMALEGKPVVITGYFLILDEQQSVYMLSKNPLASCFFCGNGGPETVVELHFSHKPSFEMDELLSAEGILQLNENDPSAAYYRLFEAEAISFD